MLSVCTISEGVEEHSTLLEIYLWGISEGGQRVNGMHH